MPLFNLPWEINEINNLLLLQDEQRTDTRKKNLLILVLNYMYEEG